MKVFSIITLIFLTLILVFLSCYLLVVRITFRYSLGRKNIAKRLDGKSGLINQYEIDLCWWDKYKFTELTIVSEDGLKLKGHYFKSTSSSNRVALLVHGYGSDFREMQPYAKMFVDMGYSVLVVENRAHGKSEGNMIGMGWFDKEDVLSWINVLVEKDEKCRIVLFGVSMGGAAVCMASGLNLPSNVVCAISDCAFANVYDQMKYVLMKKKETKARRVILKTFYKYMKRVYYFDLKTADAAIGLASCKIPVMFIHGKSDDFVPVENALKLAGKVPDYRKDVYLVENAGHAMSYVTNPRKYEFRVREFLKKYSM